MNMHAASADKKRILSAAYSGVFLIAIAVLVQ